MEKEKLKILHINCNYMGTVLHQTMIEHLDVCTDNTVFCPVSRYSERNTVPNSNVIVSRCFNKHDRYILLLKQ